MQILSIAIVAALAAFLWWLSNRREQRLHAYTDEYSRAFLEAAEHIGAKVDLNAALNTERTADGNLRILPKEDQPEVVRAMFEIGADAYVMERLRAMYALREKTQANLTTVNLIGNKFNAVLNSTYNMANYFFMAINKPGAVLTEKEFADAQLFLQKQRLLRNTTLASIVSEECAREIAAG